MFEVMAIHAGDKESFFKSWFRRNPLLFLAVLSTFVLQVLVIYVPFLQQTFETAALTGPEMLLTFLLASVILIDPTRNIYVDGRVVVNGSRQRPVVFTCRDRKAPWGGFVFVNFESDFWR